MTKISETGPVVVSSLTEYHADPKTRRLALDTEATFHNVQMVADFLRTLTTFENPSEEAKNYRYGKYLIHCALSNAIEALREQAGLSD